MEGEKERKDIKSKAADKLLCMCVCVCKLRLIGGGPGLEGGLLIPPRRYGAAQHFWGPR